MLFKDIIKKQGDCMNTSINILNFIREIIYSDEEFLAVIEEINRYEDQSRPIYVPNNIGWLDFTRDEHKEALDIVSKTIQNIKSNIIKYYRSNIAQHRACKSTCSAT